MAIQTPSEFEAALNIFYNRLGRVLAEKGPIPAVESAMRQLDQIKNLARKPAELKPMHAVLEKMSDTLSHFVDDSATTERLWDLMDYIEYWA